MKSKLLILATVLMLVLACALPAFAADIDYNDFIYNVASNGESDIVSVSIPVTTFTTIEWRLWDRTEGKWPFLASGTGSSYTYSYSANKVYGVTCQPFAADYLKLEDIPDGTVITFSYDINGAAYVGDTGIPVRMSATYFDENHKSLGNFTGTFTYGQYLEMNEVSYTIAKPAGAKYMNAAMTFDQFVPIGSNSYTLTLKAVTFQFSISSMLRLQQETGRTNKLLEQIQTTFDDFINREPDPNPPEFSDSMNDSLQAEQNILDRLPMASVLEEFRNKESIVGDSMIANTEAFRLFVLIWDKFFLYCSWYDFLVYFSLCTGCLMAFLGITAVFMSRKGGGNS